MEPEPLSEVRLAWAAGVIDVLGLIKLRTVGDTLLPAVYVSSARLDLCEALASMTGIKVTPVHRDYKRLGCGKHCTSPHHHVHSTTGRWSLTGARATVFLAAILPFLETKKGEAEQAIAVGRQAPCKPATVQKMYDLGWPTLSA